MGLKLLLKAEEGSMPMGTPARASFWQDWITLALGVWLFASPWVLGYAGQPAPAWNSWVLGVIVAIVAAVALIQFAEWEEWVNVILGAWVLVSPWIMGFAQNGPAPLWNHVVVGLLVGGLSLWDALEHREGRVVA
jgi:hypothetical protein